MYNIELLSGAEDELSEAFDWYEEKQKGLGLKLYNEVKYFLSLLENNPYQYQIRYAEELRAVALKKFPYLVIYWVDDINNIVYILSLFHTIRNPKY